MTKINNKFWTWYDSIKEPWKFIFMIIVLCIPLHISAITNNYEFMIIFIPIIGIRIWYLISTKKIYNGKY